MGVFLSIGGSFYLYWFPLLSVLKVKSKDEAFPLYRREEFNLWLRAYSQSSNAYNKTETTLRISVNGDTSHGGFLAFGILGLIVATISFASCVLFA